MAEWLCIRAQRETISLLDSESCDQTHHSRKSPEKNASLLQNISIEHSGFIPSISFDTEDKLSSPFLILGINTEQNIEIEN